MRAQQDPNVIQPQTSTGLVLPPGQVSPFNFTGDPKGGKFINWDQRFGTEIAKDEFLAKAEWAARDNPADAHFGGGPSVPRMVGKYDDRLPDGSGDNNGRPYQPGITGDDPFEGSGAADVFDGAAPGGRQPAPVGIPPAGKMGPGVPFAGELSAFYGRDFGRPNAVDDDEQSAPPPRAPVAHAPNPGQAAKMRASWPDMEAGLAAMMEDAQRTIETLSKPDDDDDDEQPMAGKASRFDKLAHRKHPPRDPKAVAAAVGRKKYGAKGMANLAHGKMSDAQRESVATRERFSFAGETQGPQETAGAPALLRPRPVMALSSETEKSLDAVLAGLGDLVKSSSVLVKSAGGSHKYISRKANGRGGYDYVYAHPNGGPAHISTSEAEHGAHIGGATTHVEMLNGPGTPSHKGIAFTPKGGGETQTSLTNEGMSHEGITRHALMDTHAEHQKKVAGKKPGPAANGPAPVPATNRAIPSELSEHMKWQNSRTPEEVKAAKEHEAKPLHERLSANAEAASARADDPSKHKFGGAFNAHRDAMKVHEKAADAHERVGNADRAVFHHKMVEKHRGAAASARKAQKSMDTITDTSGRPLIKGLYAYRLPRDGKTEAVPENLLYDYVCGFIEQAYEQESSEPEHSKLDAHDQLETMAQSVMHALVEMIPYNANLLRACKKFSITKEVVAKLLVEKGWYKPRSDSDYTDDGLGAMGAHQLAQPDFAFSHETVPFIAPDLFAVPGLRLRGPVEQSAAGMVKSEDAVDPHELLGAAHQRAARAQWGEGYARAGDAPVRPIGNCPVHNGRDIHKAQNLNNAMTPCTCGATPNPYG